MKRKLITGFSFFVITASVQSQMKIGDVAGPANADAYLQLGENYASKKGLLLPKVALQATNLSAPLTAHVEGMYVYNTSTASPGTVAQVTPGVYYNNGKQWVKVVSADVAIYAYGGPITGSTPILLCNASTNKDVIFIDTAGVLADGITTNPNLGKQWVCDGTGWKTYTPPPAVTEWYLNDYRIDAGGNKTNVIARPGSIAVGPAHQITGSYSSIVGGNKDTIATTNAGILAGQNNIIRSMQNTYASYAVIAGGSNNSVGANSAAIIGGSNNIALGQNSAIVGSTTSVTAAGTGNRASFIGGGDRDSIDGAYSGMIGGTKNNLFGDYSAIAGGSFCLVNAGNAFVGGGTRDTVSGLYAVILAGRDNRSSTEGNAIIGGYHNNTGSSSPAYSIIIGGSYHYIDGDRAVIAGGTNDTALGTHSAIIGGSRNVATQLRSIVLGGQYLNNLHPNSMLMGDGVGTTTVSTATANSFTGIYSGGYRFLTDRNEQSNKGVFINNATNTAATLDIRGSRSVSIRTGVATGTVQATDYIVVAVNNAVITLPSVSACVGREIIIRAALNGIVTVSGAGTDVIDNYGSSATNTISVGTKGVRLVSDGTLWYAIL